MEHYLDKGEVTQSAKDIFWGWSLEKWLDDALLTRGTGGGGAAAPMQSFGSNAEAVAAIGVGKLYISSSLGVNGSPYILITV